MGEMADYYLELSWDPNYFEEEDEGDTFHSDCPICHNELIERKNSKTGTKFMGCVRFPACRGSVGLFSYIMP